MAKTNMRSPWIRTIETDKTGGEINQFNQQIPEQIQPSTIPEDRDFLLLEDGFYLLQEDNSKIKI